MISFQSASQISKPEKHAFLSILFLFGLPAFPDLMYRKWED
jgi:hypothetical protein